MVTVKLIIFGRRLGRMSGVSSRRGERWRLHYQPKYRQFSAVSLEERFVTIIATWRACGLRNNNLVHGDKASVWLREQIEWA